MPYRPSAREAVPPCVQYMNCTLTMMSTPKRFNTYHELGVEWNKVNHDLTHKRNVKNVQNRNMTDLHNKNTVVHTNFINMSFLYGRIFVFPLTSFQ